MEPHGGFPRGERNVRNGSARYTALGNQAARIDVRTTARAVVLIRNVYDPGWHATVDGAAAPVFPADYVDQGVFVGPGHHTIVLSYDDPAIGYGLLGSALSILALAAAVRLLARRERR